MKNRSVISEYFRFNIGSIQGSVTTGMTVIAVLGVLMFLYPLNTFLEINERNKGLIDQILRIRHHCHRLEAHISQSNESLKDYLLTDNPDYVRRAETLWIVNCRSDIDSLRSLADNYEDPSVKALVFDLSARTSSLQAEQKTISKAHTDRITKRREGEGFDAAFVRSIEQLDRLTEDTNTILELIINLQENAALRIESKNKSEAADLPFKIFLVCLLVTIAVFLIAHRIVNNVFKKVRRLKHKAKALADGNPGDILPLLADEFSGTSAGLNKVGEEYLKFGEFARSIAQNDTETRKGIFEGKGMVGRELNKMAEKLENIFKEEDIRRINNRKMNEIFSALRESRARNDSPEELSRQLLKGLIDYSGAVQGAVYLAENEEIKPDLYPAAVYAFDRMKHRDKVIKYGEGLIGEVFREGKTQTLNRLPAGYVRITSGLGQTEPKCVLLVPIIATSKVLGILELVCMEEIPAHRIEFAEAACQSAAFSLISLQNDLKNRNLLREAQTTTELLRTQEEEMRQNLEELQATQEQMERSRREVETLAAENERLRNL